MDSREFIFGIYKFKIQFNIQYYVFQNHQSRQTDYVLYRYFG